MKTRDKIPDTKNQSIHTTTRNVKTCEGDLSYWWCWSVQLEIPAGWKRHWGPLRQWGNAAHFWGVKWRETPFKQKEEMLKIIFNKAGIVRVWTYSHNVSCGLDHLLYIFSFNFLFSYICSCYAFVLNGFLNNFSLPPQFFFFFSF